MFNPKDALQAHRHVELLRHTLPSPQAFATAALAGMGWGMQLEVLVADHLKAGTLVELVPDTPLDMPLYWQQARVGECLW